MADVMLTWGTIAFSVSEAAYQALRRSTQYRVPMHQRIGVRPGYQYTGPGEESITLSGVIMPTYRGRPAVLEDLRLLAAEGEAQKLTAGTGEDLGRWIMGDLHEERSGLFSNGQARKVAFTAKLLRDDDETSGLQTGLQQRSAAAGDVSGILDAVDTAVKNGESSSGVIAAARGAS